jgi:hypothetical protein
MKSHSSSSKTPREAAFERKLMGLRRKLQLWQLRNRELYRAAKFYKELAERKGALAPAPDPHAAQFATIAAAVEPPAANPVPPAIPRNREIRLAREGVRQGQNINPWRAAEQAAREAQVPRPWVQAAPEAAQGNVLGGRTLQELRDALDQPRNPYYEQVRALANARFNFDAPRP